MSNELNLFATSFFQGNEAPQNKKSMRSTMRQEREGTTRLKVLAAWWFPLSPSWVLS
jgi:hypothetical protein